MTSGHLGFAAAACFALAGCGEGQEAASNIEREAEDTGEQTSETLPAHPVGQYAPRDECRDQPGASEFLNGLERAVAARDADGLLALAKEDVFLDFGGGSGKELLRERLADEDYDLWSALDELMTLGCASDGQRLVLPWYFDQEISPVHDAYGSYVVTGNDVPLYASADRQDVLTTLDWDMVSLVAFLEISDEPQDAPRRLIQLENGTRGYVASDRLRSLIDYRIGVVRGDGRWRIQNFIAGD